MHEGRKERWCKEWYRRGKLGCDPPSKLGLKHVTDKGHKACCYTVFSVLPSLVALSAHWPCPTAPTKISGSCMAGFGLAYSLSGRVKKQEVYSSIQIKWRMESHSVHLITLWAWRTAPCVKWVPVPFYLFFFPPWHLFCHGLKLCLFICINCSILVFNKI